MNLSFCAWALSGTACEVLGQAAGLGLEPVDLRPFVFVGEKGGKQLDSAGLQVRCVAASAAVHEDLALESADEAVVSAALRQLDIAFEYASALGAGTAYIVPGHEAVGDLGRYAAALGEAAGLAQQRGLRLAVEHFPGRALPTVAGTLDFLAEIDHPNLYLLFDLGHAQMSNEDPVEAIEAAAPRLGYVHLDDNNGVDDFHLALLDGVLTRQTLRRTLSALPSVGYDGPVSLELNPELPDPADALRRSREAVEEALG